jgi:hypothetical protein
VPNNRISSAASNLEASSQQAATPNIYSPAPRSAIPQVTGVTSADTRDAAPWQLAAQGRPLPARPSASLRRPLPALPSAAPRSPPLALPPAAPEPPSPTVPTRTPERLLPLADTSLPAPRAAGRLEAAESEESSRLNLVQVMQFLAEPGTSVKPEMLKLVLEYLEGHSQEDLSVEDASQYREILNIVNARSKGTPNQQAIADGLRQIGKRIDSQIARSSRSQSNAHRLGNPPSFVAAPSSRPDGATASRQTISDDDEHEAHASPIAIEAQLGPTLQQRGDTRKARVIDSLSSLVTRADRGGIITIEDLERTEALAAKIPLNTFSNTDITEIKKDLDIVSRVLKKTHTKKEIERLTSSIISKINFFAKRPPEAS